jgi:hypothetical protein
MVRALPSGRARFSTESSKERHGELKLVKVNIDEEPEIAERYGIASIPDDGASSRTASLLRLRSGSAEGRTRDSARALTSPPRTALPARPPGPSSSAFGERRHNARRFSGFSTRF